MRQSNKLCWLILGLFLVGNFVLLGVWWYSSQADGVVRTRPDVNPGNQQMRMHDFLQNKVGVEGEQLDEMYGLWQEHRKKMRKHRNEIDSVRRALMDETFSSEYNKDQVNNLLDDLSARQRLVEQENYEHFRRMQQACTTDQQRQMLQKIMRSYTEKRGPHKRRRGRRSR